MNRSLSLCRSIAALAFGWIAVPGSLRAEPAAEPALTLESLVSEVTASNPELNFYRAELDAAKAGRRSAGARANPELSLEAGRKRVHDAAGILAGEGTAWSVTLTQTFEWPGRLALRRSIANRQVELAELGLERFRAALAARTRLLAYGLHAATVQSVATREVAERYRTLREIFLARDPSGLTPLLETRVIEAQELGLGRRATEAELAARRALAELNQLRGRPFEAEVRIAPPSLSFAAAPGTAEAIAAALNRNFEYRMKRVELEQQGLQVSLARHERYPDVSIRPFYSEEEAGEREQVFGLGLSVPLPITRRNRADVDTAEARRRQAEAAVQLAQRELEREVAIAAQTYGAKTREIASWAPDSVERFREAAALADRHFRLGAVPLATYVELQSAYLDAVEALLDTQQEALAAGAKLQQLTGSDFNLGIRSP